MTRPLNRRAPRRPRAFGPIALMVTLAVTGTVAGAVGAASPAAAASADPVVVSAGDRFVPRATIVLNAGKTGFLTAQEGDDRLRWIDYATGAATVLEHRLPKPLSYDVDGFRFDSYPADFGHGSDTVAVYADSPAPHVTLQQRADAAGAVTVAIPDGQSYVATYGDTVISRTGTEKETTGLHLLRTGDDGQVQDQELAGLPQGWNLTISEGDTRSVAVRGIKWEDSRMSQGWWVVDLASGNVKALSTHGESVSFDQDSVFHLGAPESYAAQVYRRDDLDAEPVTLDLRDIAYDDVVRRFGDDLVTVTPPNPGDNEYRGNELVLRDTTGRYLKSLLAVSSTSVHRTPDGSLLVAGAEERTDRGALDWGYYLFTRADDGTITRKRLAGIANREARPAGIALGSGILTTADDSQLYEPGTYVGGYRSTWLNTSGRPEEIRSTVDGLMSGRDDDCGQAGSVYCATLFASGDGFHGRKEATEQDVTMLYKNGAASWGPRFDSGLDSPQLIDLSGRFGIVDQAAGGRQSVLQFTEPDSGKGLLKRAPVGASVWGNTLWSAVSPWHDPGSAPSTKVTAQSLPSGTAAEVFDAGCVAKELQAVGRYVYWRCSDSYAYYRGAGVYDRQSKAVVRLGTDETLLGDGYLVQRSDAAGLTLVDLHAGLTAATKAADLPQRVVVPAADLGDRTGRRSGWTVDRFGGHIAYVGADRHVRIVPSGVPASKVAVIDSEVPATVDLKTDAAAWTPRWWLSKPGASWSLALKHKASGKVVRTLTGGEARGQATASWDGRNASGKLVANGAYTWTLTVKPADGVGGDLTASGTVGVRGGAAVWRDMGGDDGIGDLLAMEPDGGTFLYKGAGDGTLAARTAAGGTKFDPSTLLVPVGDVDGDRCDDVLARVGGQLRAYRPGCGRIVSASSPYTVIGSGWGQYDRLTSPGDLNGDGYVDLIARQTTTGDMYFYAGTADHTLKPKVRIGTNWKLYTRIVGAGDLNGDGRGDLLGVDKSGYLWRYYGTAAGGVTARVKIGPGWSAYTALVGPGDLTGNGRAGLLARDSAGKLWRYASNGDGTYASRVLIGTSGWNRFKDLH
ncbi:FG-GAP-like repeat-containing protein [Streptomyces sp. NPDC046939]|uniref:FG-GAP-like repeat-containing protein n=1 Tax=Streptomyces sp. NPDC046939 TaxID=3155376 RepID=UPI00340392A6